MSNEVLIAVELLEQMFALGNTTQQFTVTSGPDPEARIVGIGCGFGVGLDGRMIKLLYDRPVEPVVLSAVNQL